ncbi:MAG: hypothetical protein ACREI8_11885 [Myxococcota bacterium]
MLTAFVILALVAPLGCGAGEAGHGSAREDSTVKSAGPSSATAGSGDPAKGSEELAREFLNGFLGEHSTDCGDSRFFRSLVMEEGFVVEVIGFVWVLSPMAVTSAERARGVTWTGLLSWRAEKERSVSSGARGWSAWDDSGSGFFPFPGPVIELVNGTWAFRDELPHVPLRLTCEEAHSLGSGNEQAWVKVTAPVKEWVSLQEALHLESPYGFEQSDSP